jgi:hypothetical protein
MDTNRIATWLTDIDGWLYPPGCETAFAALPTKEQGCCMVGIIHEHRFAFFFWGLHSLDNELHPALVTIDSHDDTGVSTEVIPEDLNNLDIRNRIELGLFAWLRLRSLNDGHILPALYLNFFSDVYILLNNNQNAHEFKSSHPERQQLDRDDRMHKLKFYQNSKSLLEELPSDIPVFLDIDLDYFAVDNPKTGSIKGSELLKSDAEISSTLSIDGPLIGPLLSRIVGLTIALEPNYCGGLINSLHVLDILNRELFDGTLCTHSCKWKKRANQ